MEIMDDKFEVKIIPGIKGCIFLSCSYSNDKHQRGFIQIDNPEHEIPKIISVLKSHFIEAERKRMSKKEI